MLFLVMLINKIMGELMSKLKIGFICVHNSCRSIIAEGICREKYGELFDVYYGGSEKYDSPKQEAIDVLKRLYAIEANFTSKLIDKLPKLDIVVTMGCNVDWPYLTSKYRCDFGIDDPSGMSEQIFNLTAKIIELKIDILVRDLENGKININTN